MSSETIFFIIVVFLCLDFVLERVLESLNSKHMSPVLPDSLKGIYEEKEYSRFQSYKRENGRLDSWSSGVGFVVMIVFLVAGGFGWYNSWVVSLTDSVVWQTILFVVGLSVHSGTSQRLQITGFRERVRKQRSVMSFWALAVMMTCTS